MGCYGIGVTRIVAAAIEQRHDQQRYHLADGDGAIPDRSATAQYGQIGNASAKTAAKRFIERLLAMPAMTCCSMTAGYGPGAMFADMELIGIPHRLVLSERGLDKGEVEYKGRMDQDNTFVAESATYGVS